MRERGLCCWRLRPKLPGDTGMLASNDDKGGDVAERCDGDDHHGEEVNHH